MKIRIKSYELKSVLKKFKNLKYEKRDLKDKAAEELQKSLYIITKGSNDTVIFKVCNEIIQMEVASPAEIIEPGNALIPNELLSVIESIEEPEVIITNDEIRYGQNSINYVLLNYEFIQIHSTCPKNKLFEAPENELYRLIKNTSYCMSEDKIRPILTGLNFHENKVAALDGVRLCVSETNKFNIHSSITLPGNLVKLLLKVLNKRSEKIVQVYTDDEAEYIEVAIGDLIITSKLLEGKFIKYSSIIPEECSLKIKVDPKKLYGKMKAMFKMTSAAQEITVFTIEQDKLTIEKVNAISKIQESIPIQVLENYVQLPFKIASNAAYWKEPLKKYKKCIIEFSSRVSPIILKNDADLDLILPVRITSNF
jgi:DNA polymerase-3 subunit beta